MLKRILLGVAVVVLILIGYRLATRGDYNAEVTALLKSEPHGERAQKTMLVTLPAPDGRTLPVNYLREGQLVHMGIDGLWWRLFEGDGAPVDMLIRGEVLRGHGKVVLDDQAYVDDIFSRLRPTVPWWLPDWLNGKLVVITLTGEAARYPVGVDARAAYESARVEARQREQFLMVVFGADWCPDCLRLHENLKSPEVTAYLEDHMRYVTVDVGRKDTNLELAGELGVTVEQGIPVAVFFDPSGQPIGTTNDGQLEPSRHFTSRQILKFVRQVVEERRITAPDLPQAESPSADAA